MRKNTIIALFVLFIQIGFSNAQSTTIDSLQHLLQIKRQDSTRSLLLSQLGRTFLYSKPDTALILAQQGLILARSIKFSPGEMEGLRTTGNVFAVTGNLAKALEQFLLALKKCENMNDKTTMPTLLSNIAAVYTDQGDYLKSLEYNLQGSRYASELHDEERLLICLIGLGDTYEKLNKLDSARLYTNQSYDLAVKQNNIDGIGIALNNLGNIYSKMGQPDVAMANYRQSLPYYIREQDDEGICETSIGMAKLFLQQGKDDSCLQYAKLSYATGQKAGFIQRVLAAGIFLADYYREHKVVDSSYTYLLSVIAAKDSLFSQEKQREIQSLTFDETMRQLEITLAKTAEEKQRGHNIQFAVIALAIVIIIILFLLISRTVIANEKLIRFLGVLSLLLFFEFINLFIHPYISDITNDSPLFTLLIMVAIAALLIPFHHRIEHWIKEKMVAKNKRIRLEAAKRTVAQLEKDEKT